jgi:HSP90 family molecular chaperone
MMVLSNSVANSMYIYKKVQVEPSRYLSASEKVFLLCMSLGNVISSILSWLLVIQDYKQFWTSFGKNMKLGCIEDTSNHKRIAPLLRFNSSKNEEELISLDQYVDSMKADQKAIYYLAADTIKSAKSAPFLEELLKRDYEVLLT